MPWEVPFRAKPESGSGETTVPGEPLPGCILHHVWKKRAARGALIGTEFRVGSEPGKPSMNLQ
jgi:hypothetical protein